MTIPKVILKRGNTQQSNSYAGVIGEITYDTDLNTVRVYNGVSNGGTTLLSGNSLTSTLTSYVQNTDSRTLSGNLVISGTYFNPSSNTVLLGNSTQRWIVSANTINATGQLTANGGAKIVVQGGQDGGSSRGIFLKDGANTDYGIYLASSGANKSLANGTATVGITGKTSEAIRFRVNDYSGGFVWENKNESSLMFLESYSGDLFTKGYAYTSGLTIQNPNNTYNSNVYASINTDGKFISGKEYQIKTDATGRIDGAGPFTTPFIANTTGVYSTGIVNSASVFANTISDTAGKIRAIPKSGSAKTSNYTLTTVDVGQLIELGTGGAISILDNIFATGDVISVFNNTSGNTTITCSITTAYISGVDTDKATVTLATRGICTILFISSTVCVITGNIS